MRIMAVACTAEFCAMSFFGDSRAMPPASGSASASRSYAKRESAKGSETRRSSSQKTAAPGASLCSPWAPVFETLESMAQAVVILGSSQTSKCSLEQFRLQPVAPTDFRGCAQQGGSDQAARAKPARLWCASVRRPGD